MAVVAGAAGDGGAGGGGAGGPQRPTELCYANDVSLSQAMNAQAFKEACKGASIFQIHADKSFMKDVKNLRVTDFLAELHMQYLFVLFQKVIPHRMDISLFHGQLFNASGLPHPFNTFKRYIVLPVLARYGGNFPAGTLNEGITSSQAAQNWITSVSYNDN